MKLAFFASVLALAASMPAIVADPTKTIVENAVATPALSSLVSVLTSRGYEGLLNDLSGPGPFTVFAPNNDAFAAINLPGDVGAVTAIIQYHMVAGRISSGALGRLQFPNSVMSNPGFSNVGTGLGQFLKVAKDGNEVTIEFPGGKKAKVVVADVFCSNGIVHIVDQVIMLPEKTSTTAVAASLNTLVAAVVKAGLVDAVDNTQGLTIFAPTDAAFAEIGGIDNIPADKLAEVLKYHVVPAIAHSVDIANGMTVPTLLPGKTLKLSTMGGVKVNDANVVVADVLTFNGVVHVIDKVLMPPA